MIILAVLLIIIKYQVFQPGSKPEGRAVTAITRNVQHQVLMGNETMKNKRKNLRITEI